MTLTQEELGRRIRAARESAGLTQEQLGAGIDLSRIAIGQIESGARSVSSLELDRIAHALGRDLQSFFASTATSGGPLAALFRSDPQLVAQEDLLTALQDSLALGHELTRLERLLGIDRAQVLTATYEMPAPKTRWEAIMQGQRVALDERHRLGLGMAPIGDLNNLLEAQGVRTAAIALPENISGLMLTDAALGVFVVVNAEHALVRRRFSLAHEFAHVLLDRGRVGAVSRAENRSELSEVRANAFAAELLMPGEGVDDFILSLGKGVGSRSQLAVFDGDEVVQVEQRTPPGSQDIQLYDIALIAHHFGVSRIAAMYRLKNLRGIDDRDFQRLKDSEDIGAGKSLADFLSAPEVPPEDTSRDDFRRRFIAFALEAYRREEITRSKLIELAAMVHCAGPAIEEVLLAARID